MSGDQRLIGVWHKDLGAPGTDVYPALLRLDSNGLYTGQTQPPGAFTLWDAGTWQVRDKGQLALSTANDAVVTYAYTLEGTSTLHITAADRVRITYRRAE